jgi:hypothetical protein
MTKNDGERMRLEVAKRISEMTGRNMVEVSSVVEQTGMVDGYVLAGIVGGQIAEQILLGLDSQPMYGKRGNYGFGFKVVMSGIREDRRQTGIELFPELCDTTLPQLMRDTYELDR